MRKLSLKARLLLMAVLLASLPLAIAAFLIPAKLNQVLGQTGRQQLLQVSRDLSILCQNLMQRHVEMAQAFSENNLVRATLTARNAGSLDKQGLDASNEQIRRTIQRLGGHYQGIFICDEKGMIFSGTLKDGSTEAYAALDVHDRAYYAQAKQTLATVISDPVRSKIGNVPIVVIVAPILREDGSFAGLFGMSLEVNYIIDTISAIHFGDTGHAFAIDRKGTIFAHRDQSLVLAKPLASDPESEALSRHMTGMEEGHGEYLAHDGSREIAGFSPVKLCGWSIAASIDLDEFFQTARNTRNTILLLASIFILLAVVVAVFVASRLSSRLRASVTGLSEASASVAAGSNEIAKGASQLADSTSEQAASIEETSAALTEIASSTKLNAENASKAASLSGGAEKRVDEADARMRELVGAVSEVAAASEQTRKVIKTIDEIAFQTNILALNAAVEAARAGEAGAGFAVVADEVRNLAGRAAVAARESAETLEKVAGMVARSNTLAETTGSEFSVVRQDAKAIGSLVGEIATACREQASALAQVGNSLSQVEQGVQSGAATAEESASAAQEISSMISKVHESIDSLRQLVEGGHRS